MQGVNFSPSCKTSPWICLEHWSGGVNDYSHICLLETRYLELFFQVPEIWLVLTSTSGGFFHRAGWEGSLISPRNSSTKDCIKLKPGSVNAFDERGQQIISVLKPWDSS